MCKYTALTTKCKRCGNVQALRDITEYCDGPLSGILCPDVNGGYDTHLRLCIEAWPMCHVPPCATGMATSSLLIHKI